MKILVHSNAPFAPSGYGQQTNLLTRELQRAGHDVAISAFWGLQGSSLEWDGMRVYPGDNDWGNTWLVAYAHHHGQGEPQKVLVLTLMDVWVLQAPLLATLNLASWVPVDHSPVPPRVLEYFTRTGATPIAMSRFGERELRAAGLEPLYVPHAINTQMFEPHPQAEARRLLGNGDPAFLPADAFVVGMVANNQGNAYPRKAFPEVFQAFGRLRARHKDAYLYLHSRMRNPANGLDLQALATLMKVPEEAIRFTPEFELHLGVEDWKMPVVYSSFDVLANPSLGEGFGIPIVEAQACGVPVILNDFSSMPELLGDGWLVPGRPLYNPAQGSWFQYPDVDAIEMALESAYQARGSGPSAQARELAIQYDVNAVWDQYWVPALEVLGQRLAERTEMPTAILPAARQPNRAERRRAARYRRPAWPGAGADENDYSPETP